MLGETTALKTDESKEEHLDYEDQLVLMGTNGRSEVRNQEAHDPLLS